MTRRNSGKEPSSETDEKPQDHRKFLMVLVGLAFLGMVTFVIVAVEPAPQEAPPQVVAQPDLDSEADEPLAFVDESTTTTSDAPTTTTTTSAAPTTTTTEAPTTTTSTTSTTTTEAPIEEVQTSEEDINLTAWRLAMSSLDIDPSGFSDADILALSDTVCTMAPTFNGDGLEFGLWMLQVQQASGVDVEVFGLAVGVTIGVFCEEHSGLFDSLAEAVGG